MRKIVFAALAAACSCAFGGQLSSSGVGRDGKPYTVELDDAECRSAPETAVYFAEIRTPSDAKLAVYRSDGGKVLGCWIERDGVVMILYVDGHLQS